MRILFYKNEFAWPRSSGHDVHTYNMMRAMAARGVTIGLATRSVAPPAALAGIDFGVLEALDKTATTTPPVTQLRAGEEKFRSYWGVNPRHIARLGDLASEFKADAVVVSGLDVLPMLGAINGAIRIWYAADEWFWHHISQVSLTNRTTWPELRPAIVKGLYERAYRHRLDRVWVVSEADARAFRLVAGVPNTDVLPNGVDSSLYAVDANPGEPNTATFWGRLDFGPNIQALQWFSKTVWPQVMRRRPNARFTILGFNPTEPVLAMAALPGIDLRANVPDIRTEVGKHAVVVLPFVSGGGIKNKLLEAAAMGRPIVCSERAKLGLLGSPSLVVPAEAEGWADALTALWDDADRRRRCGHDLRNWVTAHHSWDAVADKALLKLNKGRAQRSAA
jgi:glycosyltransferase involved in cell wall biosynthesis